MACAIFHSAPQVCRQPFPAPESFVDEVGRHISAEMPGLVHAQLRAGRALLLVDGVDELPEAQRAGTRMAVDADRHFPDTAMWLRPAWRSGSHLAGCPGVRYCRDSADGWPDVLEFVGIGMQHFGQIQPTQTPRSTVASETALLDVLHARRHLRLLATSPLLCALICALNLDRRAHLPDERMELYAIALDMLLERRDANGLLSP